ncbi:hypothetical protein [Caproiciproducens faecalis]|uniref:Uncharacterized protein n=1 Tax=Caproiciproducens faecalis TaxID=2820301 RepID=A0ABS7DLG3_9FIRM|nr:hypothetical protein [Caproiciproducens faecalis]MBW7572149.1 hypothetical protein [Caproiciproducens faecalis]
MDEIKEIFCGDSYNPFLDYCELHNYKQMSDLINCRFEELPELIGISSILLSRIKAICILYFKKHPECRTLLRSSKAKTKAKTAPKTDDLPDRLLVVFQQNANKLIHISEITKDLGKGVKRNDIIHVLEHQSWCKIVDGSTFFYSPTD